MKWNNFQLKRYELLASNLLLGEKGPMTAKTIILKVI